MKRATSAVGAALRTTSAVTVLALLAFAPLHYSSTRSGGIEWLWAATGFAVVCWCISLAVERRLPALPPIMWAFAALVLVAALPWEAGLIHPTPTAPFTAAHFARIAARWPTCITWWDQNNQTGLISGLALLVLMVSDLTRSRVWMTAFAIVLTAVGVVVAAIAFAQNLVHAKTIFGEAGPRMTTNFCGPFYHHTTAGAYLNSVWPIGFALGWMGWQQIRGGKDLAMPILASLATVILLGAHAAHVSRMPQTIAMAALPVLLFALIRNRGASSAVWSTRKKIILASGATLALLLLTSLVLTTGKLHQITTRWHLLFSPSQSVALARSANPPESSWPRLMRADLMVPTNDQGGLLGTRGIAYRSAGTSILARPWFGHGPSNWKGAASEYCDDPMVRTFFQFVQFTHQDLLQFAVEWGLIGTLGWWGLLAGAPLWVLLSRRDTTSPNPIKIGAAIALGAVLLQAQWDFPLQMAAVTLNAAVLAGLCWAPREIGDRQSDTIATSMN